jgi:parallel beta-helix repeat protein
MTKTPTRQIAVLGACLCLVSSTRMGVVTPAVTAESQLGSQGWANVDCAREQAGALQRALDRARSGDTIRVSGTCNENVIIPLGTDLLTLDGGGTATINGPDAALNTLSARGVRGLTIRGFRITGGRAGISIDRGSSASIDGNTIEYVGRFGIIAGGWSTVNIVNNTIQNNPSHGINVTGNAFVFIGFATADDTIASPNTIRYNGVHGINVSFSASARIAGNTISDNVRNGVNVDRASHATVSDNTIDANGQNGIFVTENSGLNLGSDTGTGIFDAPNRTTVNNALRGISCRVGGYANGRLGTLNGNGGGKDVGTSCIDSVNLPDTF